MNEARPDPLAPIRSHAPDLLAHFDALRASALGPDGAIPQKYRTLIALAVDATKESEGGVASLAAQALAQGATKAEIAETLRVVGWICGVGNLYSAARALKDIL